MVYFRHTMKSTNKPKKNCLVAHILDVYAWQQNRYKIAHAIDATATKIKKIKNKTKMQACKHYVSIAIFHGPQNEMHLTETITIYIIFVGSSTIELAEQVFNFINYMSLGNPISKTFTIEFESRPGKFRNDNFSEIKVMINRSVYRGD